MDISPAISQRLQKLAENNNQVTALWLYGSRARGTSQPDSDYDLALMFAEYEQDVTERRLRPEILALEWQQALQQELILTQDISVIDISIAPIPLAYTVVGDNCLLYAQDELAVMMKEQQIMSKWELDYLYHARVYA